MKKKKRCIHDPNVTLAWFFSVRRMKVVRGAWTNCFWSKDKFGLSVHPSFFPPLTHSLYLTNLFPYPSWCNCTIMNRWKWAYSQSEYPADNTSNSVYIEFLPDLWLGILFCGHKYVWFIVDSLWSLWCIYLFCFLSLLASSSRYQGFNDHRIGSFRQTRVDEHVSRECCYQTYCGDGFYSTECSPPYKKSQRLRWCFPGTKPRSIV